MLKASSAHIWGVENGCPGNPVMSAKFSSNQTTAEQEHGILSHEIAARILKKEDQLIIAGDVYDNAVFYANYILDEAEGNDLHIEESVICDRIHPSIAGVPDCWFFANNRLHIYDYKYGHSEVKAEENLQCIIYAAGILEKLSGINERTTVIITIIQPRCYTASGPVRKWAATLDELRCYFNDLRSAAIKATVSAPRTRSGAHCRYCPARHVCVAAQSASYNAMDLQGVAIPHELNPDFASRELRHLQLAKSAIEYRMTGLEEQVKKWLTSGVPVRNYELKDSLGREKWTLCPEEVAALGDYKGIELRKKLEVITPAQARKKGLECKGDYTTRERTQKLAYKEK